MDMKRRVVVLVILAIIFALIAVLLNTVGSNVSTAKVINSENHGNGVVGINVKPAPVEDKGLGNIGGSNK